MHAISDCIFKNSLFYFSFYFSVFVLMLIQKQNKKNGSTKLITPTTLMATSHVILFCLSEKNVGNRDKKRFHLCNCNVFRYSRNSVISANKYTFRFANGSRVHFRPRTEDNGRVDDFRI